MPNQIPSNLPGGPVHSPNSMGFISYYKQSSTIEQWYPTLPLGFGYHNSTTLKVFYPGATDVNAVDEIRITLASGTSHTDAAEWIMLAQVYGQLHPTSEIVKKIVVTGGASMRPEFISCTITYGTCCSGGGGGSGTMSNWILSDGSTTQQIDNAETVLFADGTYINNAVSATNTVRTDLSAVNGTADTNTRFLSKDNTWDIPTYTSSYTLPEATSTARGGLELFSNTDQSVAANSVSATASRTYGLQLNAAGQGVINIPWTDTTYTLPLASTTARGGVELGSDTDLTTSYATGGTGTAGKTYPVQLNSANQMAVSVPWTDSGGCANVYKTITGTTGSTVASGCDDTLAITSPNSSIIADAATQDKLKLSARKYESFVITMTDEARPVTLGVKYTFRVPYNFTYSWYGGAITTGTPCNAPFKITVNTPPSGTEAVALHIDVEASTNNGTSWGTVFSTKPSLDGGEWSSVTGSSQMVLGSSVIGASLTCDTLLRFTVTKITGSAIGLKCTMVGYQSSIV